MVNFNNDTTITRPRQDIVNFIILQRRQECIDKLREYTKNILQTDTENPLIEAEFRAYLYALAVEVYEMLRKETPNSKNSKYNNSEQVINDILFGGHNALMEAFKFVEALLYAKGLTKSDIRDVTDPEEELFSEYDYV